MLEKDGVVHSVSLFEIASSDALFTLREFDLDKKCHRNFIQANTIVLSAILFFHTFSRKNNLTELKINIIQWP